MYFPPPPVPTIGPSLLNPEEFQDLHGFLDTITDNAFDMPASKYSSFDFGWPDEPQFTSMATAPQHPQQYRMTLNSNSLSGLDNSPGPNVHNNSVQKHIMPSTPPLPQNDHQIIVNPFHGHGLMPQTSPIHMPTEEASLSSLAWGSDPSFGNAGFHASLQGPSPQDIQRKTLAMVGANSSGNTANSPVEIKFERIGEDTTGSDAGSTYTVGNTQSPTLSATQSSGIKRRAEDGDEGLPRKSRKDPSTEPASKGKRGGKREQLTEAEKRANHIQSEQKRRNQIKSGFDTLTEMVPDLKGGGYSKSAVLQHAAVYVENLLGANIALRDMLRGLEEQRTGGPSSGA